ncbi:MAG TPA: Hsp70 family protein [Burkholderiaceae bacterium]|nr:Hsp70 family protein [Burkholderiaceae bacterium]
MSLYCAIDFGTSNSAIALPSAAGVELVALEGPHRTMPTAVFYAVEGIDPHEELPRQYGRAALAAYVDGLDGRLMRSMKSLLGSPLMEQTTEVGGGRSVAYRDVIGGFLRHLKQAAESRAGGPLERAVVGRPVFFVDDDPARDAQAQAALEAAARSIGFHEIVFQYEPIAAALDYEQQAQSEQLVLVADIGGGTSDFSLVRVGPQRRERIDRKDDILANHGVHVAGTDFDRRVELDAILPCCGYRALGPSVRGQAAREVPSRVYFDLATWHLINTVYAPQRVAELKRMRDFYADPRHHSRLVRVVTARLGHSLAAAAEAAKIEVAEGGTTEIDLSLVEPGLGERLDERQALQAIEADLQRIVDAAVETIALAGVASERIDALYFTGGSTGLKPLAERIGAAFPAAVQVRGDRFASVAHGLGLHARRFAQA